MKYFNRQWCPQYLLVKMHSNHVLFSGIVALYFFYKNNIFKEMLQSYNHLKCLSFISFLHSCLCIYFVSLMFITMNTELLLSQKNTLICWKKRKTNSRNLKTILLYLVYIHKFICQKTILVKYFCIILSSLVYSYLCII